MRRTSLLPPCVRARPRPPSAIVGWACALALVGCATPQDLGAFTAPARDADLGDAAPPPAIADPDAGFRFGTGLGARSVEACPSLPPADATACAMTTARECRYHDLDASGPITTCGRSCVCGRDGRWFCVPTTCAAVGAQSCAQGVACAGGFACSVHCDAVDAGCVSCRCEDGMLQCSERAVVTPR